LTAGSWQNKIRTAPCTPLALSSPLRPGMAVAHAMAVVPGLNVLDAGPAEDSPARECLFCVT